MVSQEEFDLLKSKLATYEEQQAKQAEEMREAVAREVTKVSTGLTDLYSKTAAAVSDLEAKIRKLEGSYGGKAGRTLLNLKNAQPDKLSKNDEWRQWKSDVEDYCEETFAGMKDILDRVRRADSAVDELWFNSDEDQWWQKGEMLWRFLKRYTSGESRKVVTGVREDNGWEAWRKLHLQFEPGLVMREAQVMSQYTNMVNKRAKNPQETRSLMVELEERAKRVEEISGEQIDSRHEMSVIVGILDPETLKHTAQFQGAKANVNILKKKVLEFVNLVTGSSILGNKVDAMDIGRFEEKAGDCNEMEGEEAWWEQHGEDELGEINGLGERCYNCGGTGHYARECPQLKGKGKGKKGVVKGAWQGSKGGKGGKDAWKGAGGKGKGDSLKGGGKGLARPQYGTCWTCGGPHFAKDCPVSQGKGAWQAGQGAVRSLCNLQIHDESSTTEGAKMERKSGASRTATTTTTEVLEGAKNNPEETKQEEKVERLAGFQPERFQEDDDDSEEESSSLWRRRKTRGGFRFGIQMKCECSSATCCRRELEEKLPEDFVESRAVEEEMKVEKNEEEGWQKMKSKRARKRERQTQNRKRAGRTSSRGLSYEEQTVCSLQTVMPEGVNALGEGDWEELEMAVDSGATETVLSDEMLTSIEIKEGEACRKGVQYEVASGTLIPNLGEKKFVAVSESGMARRMTAQVCDVNKALMSVAKILKAGNRVVFEEGNSYIEDVQTNERMYMKEQGGMFMVKLWVNKSQGF